MVHELHRPTQVPLVGHPLRLGQRASAENDRVSERPDRDAAGEARQESTSAHRRPAARAGRESQGPRPEGVEAAPDRQRTSLVNGIHFGGFFARSLDE